MGKALPLIIVLLALSGCIYDWRGKEDTVNYKGIEGAAIVGECEKYADDVCGLFGCQVVGCWCDEVGPSDSILVEGSAVVGNEYDAEQAVKKIMGEDETLKNSAKLNNIFYNVFTHDEEGNEKVYTVAVDGSIILTQCGV